MATKKEESKIQESPSLEDKLHRAMNLTWLSPSAKLVLISAILGGFEEYTVGQLDSIMQCTLQDVDTGLIELGVPLSQAQKQVGRVTGKINISGDKRTLLLSEDWR